MEKLNNNYGKSKSRLGKIKESQTYSILTLLIQKNSGKFSEDVANKLIESGNIEVLATNLSSFEGLGCDIAKILIKKGYTESLSKNLLSFRGLDKGIAIVVIKQWYGCFKYSLYAFSQLDNEIAYMLINNGDYKELAHSIRSFHNLSEDILIKLLVNCTKYEQILLQNRRVFEGGEPNDELLLRIKRRGNLIEYRKLKDFYDKIKFEEIKEGFRSNYKFEEGFDIQDAKEAIKYGKGKYVLEFLDQFRGNYRELVEILIEGRYIKDLVNSISKLWGHDIDRYGLVFQFSLTNNYNVLIKNADKFSTEGISNIKIADLIIKNSDLNYRDSIKKLKDYKDDEERNWINYNIDLCNATKKRNIKLFTRLIQCFRSDFSPLPVNRKLPLKLKEIIKEKFGINTLIIYKDLFE